MRKLVCAAVFALILVAPVPAVTIWGIDIPGMELQFGADFVYNAIDDGAVSPLVDNSFGASIPFGLAPNLLFRPEVAAYFQAYQWDTDHAVPVGSEYDYVTIISLLVNANLDYEFHFGKALTLTTGAGMALNLRFPVAASGSKAGDMLLPLTGWFFAGRFLYPNLGVGLLYQFSDKYTLFVRTQAMYPLSNTWDTLSPAWWHEAALNLLLGVRFNL